METNSQNDIKGSIQSSIQDIVLASIHTLGEIEEKTEFLNPDNNMRLFGGSGLMDSLNIVMLIAEIEDQLADEMGITVTLADDRAMSQKTSPFRSVNTLVRYIDQLLKEQNQGD